MFTMNYAETTTMKSMTAADAKRGFGALLDAAQREPVTITKNGREVAVLVSREDFERLEALEDAYWGALAEEARKEGSLGVEESERLLRSYLNATD
jgi:prevent-host-death family protein